MEPKTLTESSRREMGEEIMAFFVELVLTLKSADIPKWMDLDLTASQSRAIFFLAFRGPVTISALAKLLRMGNPATSILVQQLVRQELVERSEDAADRRRTLVRLTRRGAELMIERREQRETKFRRWLSQLSDEELAGLLQGIGPLVRIVQAEQSVSNPNAERPNE